MSRPLRLSAKWFRRGLWLVALVLAGFLIGLGGTLVGDLPQVERQLKLKDFMEPAALASVRSALHQADRTEQAAQRGLDQTTLQLSSAQQVSRSAGETFTNWLATRRATQQPDQDAEWAASKIREKLVIVERNI